MSAYRATTGSVFRGPEPPVGVLAQRQLLSAVQRDVQAPGMTDTGLE
jgi:hypothetical protein